MSVTRTGEHSETARAEGGHPSILGMDEARVV